MSAKCDTTNHLPIIIAIDMNDGYAYFRQIVKSPTRKSWRPSTLRANHSRGYIGPVFATQAVRAHKRYAELLNDARPSGITCSCADDHPARVA